MCSNRPKGEQKIAQALRPGKIYGKKIALKGRQTFGRYSQEITFVKSNSMAFQKTRNLFSYKNLRAQLGAKETGPSNVTQHISALQANPPFGRPFRAIPLCVWFPGLKPWAIL